MYVLAAILLATSLTANVILIAKLRLMFVSSIAYKLYAIYLQNQLELTPGIDVPFIKKNFAGWAMRRLATSQLTNLDKL